MRRVRHSRAWAVHAALAGVLTVGSAQALVGQDYWNFNDLSREIRSLAGSSNRAEVTSLGSSPEGREIWMLTLANPAGAPVASRPGLLVVGNLEGDHLAGSTLAVEAARFLLEQDGQDESVTRVLSENVVYVVPRLNPDGAEAYFGRVKWDRKGNATPRDDDNDGRTDEDGPDDLNGDGVVTLMRVMDPAGAYIPDPDDPRLMKRADPAEGEDGSWTVYWEGRDDDGDGWYNEDGPGGVDLNRNFQHAYPYWQADAGRHMVSESETRALVDFVVERRNIAAVVTFGHSDNLVNAPTSRGTLAAAQTLALEGFATASWDGIFDEGVFRAGNVGIGGTGRPRLRGAQPGRDNDPASGRRPATTVSGGDVAYFETVSEAYREITGIEEVGIHRTPEGAFFQYGYFHYGVPSFTTPGFPMPSGDTEDEEGAPRGAGGSFDVRMLRGMEAAGIDGFVDWAPFQHPTLGPVEIGGFRPYAVTNPPAGMLGDLGRDHGRFLARLGGMLPRVRIVDTAVESHGGGLFTVQATVENQGYFPTALRHGITARAVDPVLVQIQVNAEDIVTGDDKSATVPSLDGSGSRHTVSWMIRGQTGQRVEIRMRAQKGGSATTTVTLGGDR